jgi:hypothetical protein
MSTATLDRDLIDNDEEALGYRALHIGALIGLVLGVLSVFVLITAANSFAGCLLVAPIALAGIVVSLWSQMKIRRDPDQYTGAILANLGLALSILFLLSGVTYGWYVYSTEVPPGYERISFATMKPDELQERGGVAVPPEVKALEGQKIFIKGYIRQDSITALRGIDKFLLVRDNNQCCFGDLSKVKYYDQVSVELTGDRRIDYNQGVFRIGGILRIKPQFAVSGTTTPAFYLTADYAK